MGDTQAEERTKEKGSENKDAAITSIAGEAA